MDRYKYSVSNNSLSPVTWPPPAWWYTTTTTNSPSAMPSRVLIHQAQTRTQLPKTCAVCDFSKWEIRSWLMCFVFENVNGTGYWLPLPSILSLVITMSLPFFILNLLLYSLAMVFFNILQWMKLDSVRKYLTRFQLHLPLWTYDVFLSVVNLSVCE